MKKSLTKPARRMLSVALRGLRDHISASARSRRATQPVERQRRNPSRAAIFTRIYHSNVWGGRAGEYYSGGGSDEPFSGAYSEFINAFLDQLPERPLTVVDIGCGDFRVGVRVHTPGMLYVGVDLVPELIERNSNLFGSSSVRFVCLDVVEETPPDGDVCLIRQVFQHLSNSDIALILPRLRKYRYLFVTEHRPLDVHDVSANLDKPTGHATRMTMESGVYLDQPPFNLEDVHTVLEIPSDQDGALVTVFVEQDIEA